MIRPSSFQEEQHRIVRLFRMHVIWKPMCFYLLQGSGPQCCHWEHLLHILYYENFLFRDPCFLHSGTCYMSVLGCCCSGKIHIYCPQFLRVYMRGGETRCHPDMVGAAVRPVGVFFSFSECSFLIMSKNLVTVLSSLNIQHSPQSLQNFMLH